MATEPTVENLRYAPTRASAKSWLDFAELSAEKQRQMNSLAPQLYPDWREQSRRAFALRESSDSAHPPERLLQAIWHHQRLRRDQLRTLDGRNLRVLHPGFHNCEAGPDFRGAVIQFEGETARSGDVEVDVHPSLWRSHHHQEKRSYGTVLLHVVWDGTEKLDRPPPILALKSYLDASLPELNEWLGTEAAVEWPAEFAGQCCQGFGKLSREVLDEVLVQAGIIRLRAKAAQMQARSRQTGCDQALWEALFRALGYKHNSWPMQRLAELLEVLNPHRAEPLTAVGWQARLLGVAGLLPSEAPTGVPDRDRYVKGLWDHWWRERDGLRDSILPRECWRFNGLRPANHPQRRLALAAHWLAEGKLVAKLERWFKASFADDELADSLTTIFQPKPDEFWACHWTFNSPRTEERHPLLGATRVTDLAVNVVLPWFWMRAEASQQETMRRVALHRYLAWPRAEDNTTLVRARHRLLGGIKPNRLATAAIQQGLLQIVRDFCERSNAVCSDCCLPDLLGALSRPGNKVALPA